MGVGIPSANFRSAMGDILKSQIRLKSETRALLLIERTLLLEEMKVRLSVRL